MIRRGTSAADGPIRGTGGPTGRLVRNERNNYYTDVMIFF